VTEPGGATLSEPGSAPSTDGVLIRARGLTKRFGGFTAVDGIDLEVGYLVALGLTGMWIAGRRLEQWLLS
jgi:hypothetical protein